MRIAPVIELSEVQRVTLRKWARSRKTELRLVQRAKIVLLAADGLSNQEIARQLGTDPGTVGRWRRRFAAGGLEAIQKEAPGRGRAPSPELVSRILKTLSSSMSPVRRRFPCSASLSRQQDNLCPQHQPSRRRPSPRILQQPPLLFLRQHNLRCYSHRHSLLMKVKHPPTTKVPPF